MITCQHAATLEDAHDIAQRAALNYPVPNHVIRIAAPTRVPNMWTVTVTHSWEYIQKLKG